MFPRFLLALLIWSPLVSAHPTSVTVKATYNQQIVNLIVWICPDPTLFGMIQTALQNYRTVDDINKSVQDQVQGYKNGIWLVNTVNYSRTTADTDPKPNTMSKKICFVQAPDEEIIVFVAGVMV
ncbi:unnamed protein product [Caenorhabditis bovis]|uniref:Uncharacterized protein n=1 Tax=Caenorhabditis bovis TaxID=2654633 RepID=A0A8S1EU77_9PELO|nr:unnamed protein product [Caenorhabditis bovis]